MVPPPPAGLARVSCSSSWQCDVVPGGSAVATPSVVCSVLSCLYYCVVLYLSAILLLSAWLKDLLFEVGTLSYRMPLYSYNDGYK